MALQNLNLMPLADLDDQRTNPIPYRARQNPFSILRHPHNMVLKLTDWVIHGPDKDRTSKGSLADEYCEEQELS